MALTTEGMVQWCEKLLGGADAPQLSFEQYVADAVKLDALADLPAGSVVLVRGDVDAKPGPNIGDGDVRLQSMVETLKYGQQKGWKQVVFGHIGRKPEGSLNKVAARLSELLGCPVPLVSEWYDPATDTVLDSAAEAVAKLPNGGVLLLENVRKYDVETLLWKAKPADLPKLAPRLAKYAEQLASKFGTAYVHEAFSAGSLDASSVVAPAGMKHAALGLYIADQLSGPLVRCRDAELVVFSGLKTDKLDDLEAIVERGKVRMVIAAGSLAMALIKARGQIEGKPVSLGVAEDPSHAAAPYYIADDRVAQAQRILEIGASHGTEFVLPVDFVLADGSSKDALAAADQQFDVGPKTSLFYADKCGAFIDYHRAQVAAGKKPAVAFHNGVFGKFEEARYELGTKEFMNQLRRMTQAGVEVYVGGGEGGAALEKYGQPEWITHCFTAGGTVLNALGANPIPYLQSLYQAKHR